MAYRPPSQSRYASITAPPPPGPFSARGKARVTQDNDGWITPVPRRIEPSPIAKILSAQPTNSFDPAKPKEEDFPSLGSSTVTKKVWGSTSNESMAERMKKRIEEEEEERLAKENERLRKEQEKNELLSGELIPHNIINHRNLMQRFKDDENETHEDYEYYSEADLDYNGYGLQNEYKTNTPDYSYEEEYQSNDENYDY